MSKALPAAIIGVGGFGGVILRALQKCPEVELVGLADRDAALAAKTAAATGLRAYSDNRSLLAEARPAAVFLCVPPMAAPDLVALCAERGIHVWKEMPLARNLTEGAAMVRRMEKAGLKLAVGTQRRFAAGYRRAWQLRRRVGQVFLARAHYLFNWGPDLLWRGDKASAGGGALLELGYHPIDLLVWLMGLPDEVYGSIAGGKIPSAMPGAKGKLQPPYDTDDTAAALLRYSQQCVATVVTTRCSGPVSEELSLHGQKGSLVASGEECLLRNPDGNILDQASEQVSPLEIHTRQLGAFAKAVGQNSKWCECSGLENLLNLVVIDAIYLSERTNQPEQPLRLLKTLDLTVDQCLACRPPEQPDAPADAEPPPED